MTPANPPGKIPQLNFWQPELEHLLQITTDLGSKLTGIFELDELAERAVRLIQQQLGYDQVALYLCGLEEGLFLVKFVASKRQSQVVKSYNLKNEASLAQAALQEGRPIRINNFTAEVPPADQVTMDSFRSELHLLLARDNETMGVLSFRSTEANIFDDYKVMVLTGLAGQLALALEQARHYSKRQKQIDRQPETIRFDHQLQKIGLQDLLQFQTLEGIQEVLDRIVKAVVNELGYLGAMLAVLDEEKQILPVRAVAYSSRLHQLTQKAEQILGIQAVGTYASLISDPGNLGVQSCKTGQIKISHDLYDLFQPAVSQKWSQWIQKLSRIKTCISIPLLVDDLVMGNLYAATTKSEVSPQDLQDLQLFVANAAIALQITILFEKINEKLAQREAELNQLRSIGNTINSSVEDLQKVLQNILRGALELTRAEYGHVVLMSKYAADSIDRVSYPEFSEALKDYRLGITQLIVRDKKPQLINNTELIEQEKTELKRIVEQDQSLSLKMRSQLGVPIVSGDELIGVINIGSQEAGAFDEQSLSMLEQLAVQAAIAIKNAHSFKEQKSMEKQLASAGQVVAMGDIASNMVHSLNNWIGSIRADAKYLLRQCEQDEFDRAEVVEILTDMLNNAEKTLTMAEKIRHPFQHLNSELIDVNECLLNVLRDRIEDLKQVYVLKELERLPPVEANQQLQLVFDNLVGNALQAMRQQERQRTLGLQTRCSTDRQWVEVKIRDSGPGLSHHINRDDIFKLGVTSRKEGMGYGLWWCDTFLKRLKGDIRLVESSSKGCEFLVRLPIPNSGEAGDMLAGLT